MKNEEEENNDNLKIYDFFKLENYLFAFFNVNTCF